VGRSTRGLSGSKSPQDMRNGIGFLGGVVTRSLPVESCVIPAWTDASALGTPCEVTYSAASATMQGTVRDALCGDSLGGAFVELEAPLGGPHRYAQVRKVRTHASDGAYRIAGLDPGVPHVRRVWNETEWYVAGRIWAAREDTVEFLPGQRLTVDIDLQRRLSILGRPLGPECGY